MYFKRCEICQELIILKHPNDSFFCCGKQMQDILPNKEEFSFEKHIPVYSKKENQYEVRVGSVLHPMEEKHFIEWILIETKDGFSIQYLKDQPIANFVIEEAIAIYAYCNIHGLWKQELT